MIVTVSIIAAVVLCTCSVIITAFGIVEVSRCFWLANSAKKDTEAERKAVQDMVEVTKIIKQEVKHDADAIQSMCARAEREAQLIKDITIRLIGEEQEKSKEEEE